jgi:hypothetical protein
MPYAQLPAQLFAINCTFTEKEKNVKVNEPEKRKWRLTEKMFYRFLMKICHFSLHPHTISTAQHFTYHFD